MAEQEKAQEGTVPGTEGAAAVVTTSTDPAGETESSKLRLEVQAVLATRSPTIREAVIQHLAAQTMEERTKQVLSVIEKVAAARKAVFSVKPAQRGFDKDGKVISESYSKEQIDEINKQKSIINKIETALGLAFDKGDWSKLGNC